MLVSSVSYAMTILEALADNRSGASVSELSARVGLNKGSIVRILATLQSTGHVLQDEASEHYYLSLQTVSLANRHMDSLGFPELIQPVLNELAEATGELAQLTAADSDRLFVIAKAEGPNHIRVESLLGRQIALHASSGGKAWLSSLAREQLFRVLGGIELLPLTSKTITKLSVLEKEIEDSKKKGFSIQREELMKDMSGIAVPVHASVKLEAVGSLAIAAPTFRFPVKRMNEVLPLLRAAAIRIGETWPRSTTIANPDYARKKAALR